MSVEDIKDVDVPGNEDDTDDDDAAAMALAAKIASVKAKESAPSEEDDDTDDVPAKEEPAKEPAKESASEEEDEPDDKPADKQEPEKPAISDEEIEARVNARVQELIDAKVREASQKAADAVLAKERAREDSARQKLKAYELKAGKSLDALIAEYTGQQVQTLVDQGYDEETAKRLVNAEAKAREFEAREQERQREHAIFTAKNNFARELSSFVSDPNADASVKKLTVKYQQDIEEVAYGAIENGQGMSMEIARDYVLGRHLPELLKEQQAELDRVRTATQAKTLKDVQERGKAKVESGTAAVPSAPTVSREERAFLRKLGMDDNDIADIAKKRAAKKK